MLNTTQTFEDAAIHSYGNAIAYAVLLSYLIGLTWMITILENRTLQPTGWRYIGDVSFSSHDVNPPVLQTSPLYERTYPSGKQSWRVWDDATEEWVYHAAR
jgi:hypothetical protein